jgi:hypothetical protein
MKTQGQERDIPRAMVRARPYSRIKAASVESWQRFGNDNRLRIELAFDTVVEVVHASCVSSTVSLSSVLLIEASLPGLRRIPPHVSRRILPHHGHPRAVPACLLAYSGD